MLGEIIDGATTIVGLINGNSQADKDRQHEAKLQAEYIQAQSQLNQEAFDRENKAAIEAASTSQEYAKEMAGVNFKYNEQAASNADIRARKLYEDTQSYTARVAEMKKAGLNPALMMANGGGSAQNVPHGAQGAGATGGGGAQRGYARAQAPDIASAAMAAQQKTAVGIQLQQMKANTRLQTAETIKTLVDAGVGKAQIKNLEKDLEVKDTGIASTQQDIRESIARTGNIQLERIGIKLENARNQLQLEIEGATKDTVIATASQNLNLLYNQADSLLWSTREQKIDVANKQTIINTTIEQMKADTLESIQSAMKLQTGRELDEKELESFDEWMNLTLEGKRNEANLLRRQFKWLPITEAGKIVTGAAVGLGGMGMAAKAAGWAGLARERARIGFKQNGR